MMDNTLLNEVQEALLRGDRATAKEILMKLVRGDQNNASYWLYLSAVMDSREEKISCLKKALHFDPENEEAKKGLRVLGQVSEAEAMSSIEWTAPKVRRDFPIHFYDEEDEDGAKRGKKEKTPAELAKQKRNRIIFASAGFVVVVLLAIFRPFAPTVVIYPTPTEGDSFSLLEDVETPTVEAVIVEETEIVPTMTPAANYTATPYYVSTPHSDEYYRLAMNALDNEEWEEAIFYLDVLTKTEEKKADIYYHMGEAYEQMSEFKKAYSHYGLAVREDTRFGPGYLGIARMEMELYSVSTAKENLDKALKYSPDFLNVYLARADYFFALNDFRNALSELSDAEELDPENGAIFLKRAEIYFEQRDYEKALEEAEVAHDYYYQLYKESPLFGKIYLALGDGEEALRLLTIYTRANPDDTFALLDQGLAYLVLEDYDKAIELFEELVQDTELRRFAYTYLGRAYMAQGDMENALPALNSGAALNPYSYEAHYYLAQGYHIEEQSTNGFRSYVSALKQDMTDQERMQVLYDFALFCEDFNLRDEAERYWEELGVYGYDELPEDLYEALVERYPKYKPTVTPIPTSTRFPTKTATPAGDD